LKPPRAYDVGMTLTVEEARSLLGVTEGATCPQVGSAFRAIARHCHPDKCTAETATSEFQLLSEARDLLMLSARHAEERKFEQCIPTACAQNVDATSTRVSTFARSTFAQRGLVWGSRHCLRCRRVCMQLQRDTAMCECGHRLRAHDPFDLSGAFHCGQCSCEQFRFKEQSRCRCGCPSSAHSCKLFDSTLEFEADNPQRGGQAMWEPTQDQPTARSPRREHKDLPPLNKRKSKDRSGSQQQQGQKEMQTNVSPRQQWAPNVKPSPHSSPGQDAFSRQRRKCPDLGPDPSLPPDVCAARFHGVLGAYAEGLGGE